MLVLFFNIFFWMISDLFKPGLSWHVYVCTTPTSKSSLEGPAIPWMDKNPAFVLQLIWKISHYLQGFILYTSQSQAGLFIESQTQPQLPISKAIISLVVWDSERRSNLISNNHVFMFGDPIGIQITGTQNNNLPFADWWPTIISEKYIKRDPLAPKCFMSISNPKQNGHPTKTP